MRYSLPPLEPPSTSCCAPARTPLFGPPRSPDPQLGAETCTGRGEYREGDWFAVPSRDGGFAVGVIARANPGGVLLGYSFGTLRSEIPAPKMWMVRKLVMAYLSGYSATSRLCRVRGSCWGISIVGTDESSPPGYSFATRN